MVTYIQCMRSSSSNSWCRQHWRAWWFWCFVCLFVHAWVCVCVCALALTDQSAPLTFSHTFHLHASHYTHTIAYTNTKTNSNIVYMCAHVCVCLCTHNTDLLLSPSESLHLWSVGHNAEPSTFTLLKILLILHLQESKRERKAWY